MANALKDMEYPGRGIVMGVTKNNDVFVAYFITGRSPSSQARKLDDNSGHIIFTEPTDPAVLAQGNPELLIYNAMAWDEGSGVIAVSNGKQTDSVMTYALCSDALDIDLSAGTRQWNFEPDEPNYTPRISGLVVLRNEEPDPLQPMYAQLGIISRGDDGKAVRRMFEVDEELRNPKNGGLACLLTTYDGRNVNPLPPFQGEPRKFSVESTIAPDLAEELGDMLRPEFRVSVAALVCPHTVEECFKVPGIKNYRN